MAPLAGLLVILTGVFSHAVDAHSLFTNLHVNNVDQGDGTCIRMPQNSGTATNPITDLQDNAMVCGFDGTKGVQRVCSVPAGSQLGFEYRTFPDKSEPGSVEPSHKGPCAVYLKAVSSSQEATGEGDGWFKVYEDGYDTNSGKWCSDKIIENDGIMNINLPKDLARGDYLVRSELLALQEADKSPPQPQFYVGCAQIFLDSNENAGPPQDLITSIPGHVKMSDPSVSYNIYSRNPGPYSMPGPKLYTSGVPTQRAASANRLNELLPPKTVAVNGNWYGTEQEAYNSENGCYEASNNCYGQLRTCYDTAPATGSKGCKAYEQKCAAIQSGCQSGNFNGPPDEGKILTAGVKGNVLQARSMDAVSSDKNSSPNLPIISPRSRLRRNLRQVRSSRSL